MHDEYNSTEAADAPEDASADADDGGAGAGGEPGWVERHLAKILVAAVLICAVGLIGRALTG